MDVDSLNKILEFLESDFRASSLLPASGQRKVYQGSILSDNTDCVIKLSPINPISVGRIQREIRVLGEINSDYFPILFHQSFITDSIISDFFDSFDTREKEQLDEVTALRSLPIKPFLLTTEEFIENVSWADAIQELRKEPVLVEFLIHMFAAVSLLWDAQIAHRDLKPDNILLRPDLRPVIIDLGIAKSFRPGTQQFTIINTPCTPRYAAPEQLMNTKADITYKTDQFAIGVIAFYILTEHFPYGDVHDINELIIENFLSGNLSNIRDYNDSVSEKLIILIEKLLQVHPYKRFRNTGAILQKLSEIRGMMT